MLRGYLVLAQATTEKATPASGHVVEEAGIQVGKQQRVLEDAKCDFNRAEPHWLRPGKN